MEYLVIGIAAFLVSGLTLFSGFGLGTLLLPLFAIFYPLDLSIALTAIVHFLNNLFKLALLARKADYTVVARFGIPALLASLAGARILVALSGMAPLWTYELAAHSFSVTPFKLVISVLMILFAFFEIVPRLAALSFDRRYLIAGGVLSGFFGGLSGHQGALRSAFLLKAGLGKEAFIATGVVIACLVDAARLPVYAGHLSTEGLRESAALLVLTVLSAFAGAWLGSRYLQKVTLRHVQVIVAAMLFGIAVALGSGLI